MTTDKSNIDIFKRLNTRLKMNEAWRDLFKATQSVLDEVIGHPLHQLATVRDARDYHRGDNYTVALAEEDGKRVQGKVNYIRQNADGSDTLYVQLPGGRGTYSVQIPNIKDRETLINESRRHGINYFSDTLGDEDYARIVEWVEKYWPTNDTNFVNFMGFIKNMRLDIHQLWSQEDDDDEYPFLERFYSKTMYPNVLDQPDNAGHKFYPTSHVELTYDVLLTPDPDFVDLIKLFYLMAPIHLVMERIVAEVYAEVPTWSQGTMAQVRTIEQSSRDLGTEVYLTLYTDTQSQVRTIPSGKVWVNGV